MTASSLLRFIFPLAPATFSWSDLTSPSGLMAVSLGSMGWIAAGSAILGAGTSLIGANKSAKAQQAAIDANSRAQEEANRLNYQRWLETQGVGPDGNPVNIRLPRYVGVSRQRSALPGFRLGQPTSPRFTTLRAATGGGFGGVPATPLPGPSAGGPPSYAVMTGIRPSNPRLDYASLVAMSNPRNLPGGLAALR